MSDNKESKAIMEFQDRRAVILSGEVTRGKCEKLVERLTELQFNDPDQPVKMLIYSDGGHIKPAEMLCDFMDHVLEIPVHGYVVGNCDSAATYIFLSCERRFCTPKSTFLLHSISRRDIDYRLDGEAPQHLNDLIKEAIAEYDRHAQLYQQKLGITIEAAKELIKRGDQPFNDRMDAVEARKIGLVHEIVTGKIGLFSGHKK